MPFDPETPDDSAELARIRALPHIIVHPKWPPGAAPPAPPPPDGIDDWFVPGNARIDPYPNDWFVPSSPASNMGQPAPGPRPNAANASLSKLAVQPSDPFAAYRSQIPASRVGAMAWDPPNLPLFAPSSTNNFSAPTSPFAPPIPPGSWPPLSADGSPWSSTRSLTRPAIPQGGLLGQLATLGMPPPAIPQGGLLGALATLGTPPPATPAWPQGGLLGGLSGLGSSSPAPSSLFPSPPQSASAQAVSPIGRRPIGDYSTGEIAGDAAKSLGVGTGEGVIHLAGLPGDVREMLANGTQRAADYFAPGYAPNAGTTLSNALTSTFPSLSGPTSSQIQNAVESYTGPFYQPKTIVGDYAHTAGEFLPASLLAPGGGLAINALRYGLIPALSSETAGQLTKGTAAEPWARSLGAIFGAAPGAWRNLPWTRSAPDAGPAIEQELAALSERAGQIHGALDRIAQSRRATAILSTDGDTIVAGGKRDLDPVQRALVRPGERPAKLPGAHAEITALAEAENAGLNPRALVTSRPICPECRAAIEDARGVLTSKFTAVFPK